MRFFWDNLSIHFLQLSVTVFFKFDSSGTNFRDRVNLCTLWKCAFYRWNRVEDEESQVTLTPWIDFLKSLPSVLRNSQPTIQERDKKTGFLP